MNQQIKAKYDKGADVLYIVSVPGAKAISREGRPGVMWRFDERTGTLVGVTIIDFDGFWKPQIKLLVEDISREFAVPKRKIERLMAGVH